jgi:hypothetical protein
LAIHQHGVVLHALHQAHSLRAVDCDVGAVAQALDHPDGDLQVGRVVLDDENPQPLA